MKVCAGIILYNPDTCRLEKNINAIQPQVDLVVLLDNASDNIDELQKMFDSDRFVWIKNDKNIGIAGALNQLIEFADVNDYQWILTLDQDSICGDDLVRKLVEASEKETANEKSPEEAGSKGIAMVGPLIMDRGIADTQMPPDTILTDIQDVRLCITSGCLTNIKAVLDIGGFNEWLFIDEVDREICLRLVLGGYRLIRVNTVMLSHEYGLKTITRRILWKDVLYRNYAPVRVYYQTRNLVYMLRKYGREYTPSPFRRWVRLFIAFSVKFVCEPDRIQRLKSFIRGIREGLSVNIIEI